jgi:hypothetical protein
MYCHRANVSKMNFRKQAGYAAQTSDINTQILDAFALE